MIVSYRGHEIYIKREKVVWTQAEYRVTRESDGLAIIDGYASCLDDIELLLNNLKSRVDKIVDALGYDYTGEQFEDWQDSLWDAEEEFPEWDHDPWYDSDEDTL